MQKSGFFSKTPSSILLKLHQRGSFGSIIHQKKTGTYPHQKIFSVTIFPNLDPPHVPTGRNCRGCLKLPWKAPNYPKTPPTGMKHNYESFGATLGPFGYLILGPFWPKKALLGAPEVLRQPRGARFGPNCHWLVQLGRPHQYNVLGPLKGPLQHSWGPQKGPFWPQKALLGALEVL